jgi:hypothetical protein
MAAITFMPWYRIDRNYDLLDLSLIRFNRATRVEGVDGAVQDDVHKVLGTYKDIKGEPVDKAALLVLKDKNILADLNDDDRDLLYELIEVVRFGGLANREYFDPIARYCNSDCFPCYVQRFATADFTSLTSRRREGSTQSSWPIAAITISMPLHCSPIRKVVLDEHFIESLFRHRRDQPEEWTRWHNAISCFNQANTDAENVRHQVEWVLLCSAFEHLLDAGSKAIDVATRFANLLVPSESRLVRNSTRISAQWRDTGQSLRFEWMREFYRIRGDFAHGQLQTRQDMVWGFGEHLVLVLLCYKLS